MTSPMRNPSPPLPRLPWRRGLALALGITGLAMLAQPGAARDGLALRPVALGTQANVALEASVFVERETATSLGPVHTLEPARRLTRGDRVVTLLTWYRLGRNGGFVVTNALPSALSYQPDDRDEDVSVDGGRSWGRLGTLRVAHRLATAQDVTHVRWRIAPAQAMSGSGRIVYAGLVR